MNDKVGERWLRRFWPWAILALLIAPAVWHVVDYENDLDPEFPRVERPTFSKMPPASYRLAEPGDTIDHLGLYAASIGIVLSLLSRLAVGNDRKTARLWEAAFALSAVAFWHACAPGPWPDGTRGLGWRNLIERDAPPRLRLTLLIGAAVSAIMIGRGVIEIVGAWRQCISIAKRKRIFGFLLVAAVLVATRQCEIPGVEPVGYWPKWAFFWGLSAFDLALIRCAAHRIADLPFGRRHLRNRPLGRLASRRQRDLTLSKADRPTQSHRTWQTLHLGDAGISRPDFGT